MSMGAHHVSGSWLLRLQVIHIQTVPRVTSTTFFARCSKKTTTEKLYKNKYLMIKINKRLTVQYIFPCFCLSVDSLVVSCHVSTRIDDPRWVMNGHNVFFQLLQRKKTTKIQIVRAFCVFLVIRLVFRRLFILRRLCDITSLLHSTARTVTHFHFRERLWTTFFHPTQLQHRQVNHERETC